MFRYLIESGEYMEAMVKRCAGLDVHQETIVACVLTGELDKKPESEIRTFETYKRRTKRNNKGTSQKDDKTNI